MNMFGMLPQQIWLVSEYVDGSSLRERLDDPSDDNLSSMALCKYASQTAAGCLNHGFNVTVLHFGLYFY